MTVRDPPAASRRWTRWNSGTDGESPEERERAGWAHLPASSRCARAATEEVRVDEREAMRAALAASAGVLGTTSPNPPVGAVVLDARGELAGTGATAPPGGPHAEVLALAAAGPRARGGTVVVTLEPCRHTGRTGPCTRALTEAGVARVVVACADPTAAAGGGADELRAAGVDVQVGLLADEVAVGPLEAWLTAQRTGRPHVTWKYAATLDGRSAAADGSSRWITGPVARADVHRLRAEADAVLVGVGTVLADDPRADRAPRPGSPAAAGRAGPDRPDPARRPGAPGAGARRRPGRGAGRAGGPGRRRRAAGGRADARRGVPARPGWSTGWSATSPRPCWAPGRPRWPARAWERSPRRVRLRLDDVTRLGDDVRLVLRPHGAPDRPDSRRI